MRKKNQVLPTLHFEQAWWDQGHSWVAGVDEAGRGPLAGPVVAAAVVLPDDAAVSSTLAGLTDSKALKPAARDYFFDLIQATAIDYALGIVSNQVIDRINILQATWLAMGRALAGLERIECALVDGPYTVPYWRTPQQALVRGDSRSLSIAAASVLAKVARDRIMVALDAYYPAYGFARHKGYPTAFHRQQIGAYGLSPLHRLSFCHAWIPACLSPH